MYVSDLITDLAVVTIWPPLGPRIKSVFVKLHFSTVLLPYLVLLYYSHKSWSIFKTRESFEVLTFSKHPQHVQFDQGLAKIFEVRLKTNDYILLFS